MTIVTRDDVCLQPMVGLDGRWTKCEGLARNVPAWLALSPAEKQLHDLQMFTIGGATVAGMQSEHPGLGYSGNILPEDLAIPGFGARLVEAVIASGLPPRLNTVEVVESQPLNLSNPTVIENLRAIARAGINIAFDDVGSDHLANPRDVWMLATTLRRYNIHLSAIKIDRLLMETIETDDGFARILAFVKIAELIGAIAVAEGANKDQHLDLALQVGCKQFQCFRFGKKMAVEDCHKQLRHKLRRIRRRKHRPLAALLNHP